MYNCMYASGLITFLIAFTLGSYDFSDNKGRAETSPECQEGILMHF